MNECYENDYDFGIGLFELDPFNDGFWWEVLKNDGKKEDV